MYYSKFQEQFHIQMKTLKAKPQELIQTQLGNDPARTPPFSAGQEKNYARASLMLLSSFIFFFPSLLRLAT